jgi:hypothetical protein
LWEKGFSFAIVWIVWIAPIQYVIITFAPISKNIVTLNSTMSERRKKDSTMVLLAREREREENENGQLGFLL